MLPEGDFEFDDCETEGATVLDDDEEDENSDDGENSDFLPELAWEQGTRGNRQAKRLPARNVSFQADVCTSWASRLKGEMLVEVDRLGGGIGVHTDQTLLWRSSMYWLLQLVLHRGGLVEVLYDRRA